MLTENIITCNSGCKNSVKIKFLFILIILVVFLNGISLQSIVTINAAETDPKYFEFDSTTGTITDYDTDGGLDVVIPSVIDGVEVQAIGDSAFWLKNLTSVEIPDSVTEIGDSAFASNNLTSAEIPDSVMVIGDWAFRSNELTSVEIPDSVKEIGRSAFSRNNLTEVKIPDSVMVLGDSAFLLNNLTSVKISDSVTEIGVSAFASNNLTSVEIPDSVIEIGEWAFNSNDLTSVEIPDSVIEIGEWAFNSNDLTSVEIGDIVSLWENSFHGNFKEVYRDYNKSAGIYLYEDGEWRKQTETPIEKPQAPFIVEPGTDSEPGEIIETINPTLKWEEVDNADYYALAISEYPYGTENIIHNPQEIYGNYYDIPDGVLKENTKYSWNMQAYNEEGGSDVSNTLYFKIEKEIARPDKPEIIYPKDGEESASTIPVIKSRYSHPNDKKLKNSFWVISRSSKLDDYIYYTSGGKATLITIPINILEHNKTYYSFVAFQDEQGDWSELSDHSSFHTHSSPIANFSSPDNVESGTLVELDASNSKTKDDGEILLYIWDLLGDGKADISSKNPRVNYWWGLEGDYDITLTVVDNKGGISTSSANIKVEESLLDRLLYIYEGIDNNESTSALSALNNNLSYNIEPEYPNFYKWFGVEWPYWRKSLSELGAIDKWIRDGRGDRLDWLGERGLGEIDPFELDYFLSNMLIEGEEDISIKKYLQSMIFQIEFVDEGYKNAPEDMLDWVRSNWRKLEMLEPWCKFGATVYDAPILGAVKLPWAVANYLKMAHEVGEMIKIAGYISEMNEISEELNENKLIDAFSQYILKKDSDYASSPHEFDWHLHLDDAFDIEYESTFWTTREYADKESRDQLKSKASKYFDRLLKEYGNYGIRGEGLDSGFVQEERQAVKDMIENLLKEGAEALPDKNLVYVGSPVEVSTIDTRGNVTGMIDGEIYEEAINSLYDDKQDKVIIIEPELNDYIYQLSGKREDIYTFNIYLRFADEFNSKMPINYNENHYYKLDRKKFIDDQESITLQIDKNSDGNIDHEIKTGANLKGDRISAGSKVNISFFNYGADLVFEEITGEGMVMISTSSATTYTSPAEYSFLDNYYRFETTADYEGDIKVTISYDDENLSSKEEERLKLFNIKEDGEYVEVGSDINMDDNTISGKSDTLGLFVVGYKLEDDEFALDVKTEGKGSVELNPEKDLYKAGDIVDITAIPGENWVFSEWIGDVDDKDNVETTITIDEDKNVTAVFVRDYQPDIFGILVKDYLDSEIWEFYSAEFMADEFEHNDRIELLAYVEDKAEESYVIYDDEYANWYDYREHDYEALKPPQEATVFKEIGIDKYYDVGESQWYDNEGNNIDF